MRCGLVELRGSEVAIDNRLMAFSLGGTTHRPARPLAALASEESERKLIRAAQRGSDQALEELFRRHWRDSHRAAYLIVRDAAAAEDIAQEAFIAAIRALDRFDRRRPFAPWLHRITVNRAIDWTRARQARREHSSDESDGFEPAGPGIDIDALADSELVFEALSELGPEHRAVVVMRHLLGYTPGEIAKLLELPRGTVNSRLRRGLDALAAALEDGEEAAT